MLYPGAVALVSLQDVKPGMKIVKVDGHKPDEAGYPLDRIISFSSSQRTNIDNR